MIPLLVTILFLRICSSATNDQMVSIEIHLELNICFPNSTPNFSEQFFGGPKSV